MNTTQNHLSISDIQDNIILLKSGGGALVLQVSAVNFGLLSEREQMAIVGSFAQMLNSLSFSIQIVIHSEQLNISSYLKLLDQAEKAQSNPLLSKMIVSYKEFIKNTIKDNEVLDKKFYIVIPLFKLELGITPSKVALQQKIKTVLFPRRDQVIKQLGRIGLKAVQLESQKLIEIFYDIYSGLIFENNDPAVVNPADLAVKLKNPALVPTQTPFSPTPPQGIPSQPGNLASTAPQPSRAHPFVVEELTDNS